MALASRFAPYSSEPALQCHATADIIWSPGTVTHRVARDLLDAAATQVHNRAMGTFRRRIEQQGIAAGKIRGLPDGTVRYWDAELALKF